MKYSTVCDSVIWLNSQFFFLKNGEICFCCKILNSQHSQQVIYMQCMWSTVLLGSDTRTHSVLQYEVISIWNDLWLSQAPVTLCDVTLHRTAWLSRAQWAPSVSTQCHYWSHLTKSLFAQTIKQYNCKSMEVALFHGLVHTPWYSI